MRVTIVVSGTAQVPGVASVPIAFISNTLLVNYLTADGALSAYPSLTLRFRSLFHIGRIHQICGNSLPTYARFGVQFCTNVDNWDTDFDGCVRPCMRSWVSPCVSRILGDGGCLVLSFNSAPLSGLGTRCVMGDLPRCQVHPDRLAVVHLPTCGCP